MPYSDETLECEQGSTWAHGWRVTYNKVPIDDTWTVTTATLKKESGGAVIHTFNASVGDSGAVVIALRPEDTEPWDFREAVYLVKVSNGSGVTLRVAQGLFQLDKEV